MTAVHAATIATWAVVAWVGFLVAVMAVACRISAVRRAEERECDAVAPIAPVLSLAERLQIDQRAHVERWINHDLEEAADA